MSIFSGYLKAPSWKASVFFPTFAVEFHLEKSRARCQAPEQSTDHRALEDCGASEVRNRRRFEVEFRYLSQISIPGLVEGNICRTSLYLIGKHGKDHCFR